ncbi:hypothetical protein BofuT4_P101590.1 [Botrytis cinerea T4]|uniref:Uncharacterized protein n=1 Tax=Botryotinia fuckeliana (strain T4) TaxID=999810 RepID=G2YC14_BOTF4|nr:hypothetical protein BofuT4_P101590.1 [Botrytis cinerea T4]
MHHVSASVFYAPARYFSSSADMSLSDTKPRSSHDGTFDEESPLLDHLRPTTATDTHSLIHQTHSPRIIISLLTAIVFIIGFGGYLAWIPSMRIYEDILCHRYYEERRGGVGLSSTIDEARCKGDEVQEELNILTAVMETLKALPGRAELSKKKNWRDWC